MTILLLIERSSTMAAAEAAPSRHQLDSRQAGGWSRATNWHLWSVCLDRWQRLRAGPRGFLRFQIARGHGTGFVQCLIVGHSPDRTAAAGVCGGELLREFSGGQPPLERSIYEDLDDPFRAGNFQRRHGGLRSQG